MLLSAAIASSDGLSIDTGAPTRDFEFTYVAKLSSLPGGARLSRVWIPLPQTDGYQTIDHLRIETALRYSTRRDPDYGNEYLYLEIPAVAKSPEPAEVRVTFHATRPEHRVILNERAPDSHAPAKAVLLDRCKAPSLSSRSRSPTASKIRSPRLAPSSTTSSPPCVTTNPARAGAMAMPSGRAPPSAVTARTSTRS